MSRYLGPKVKLSRKVGVPIADIPKHTSKRQLTTPGVHGARGRRQKAYGIRKDEKQKLRFHYNVLERQFRRYLVEAGRRPGNTGEVLMQLLELRLDNVLRRAGFARTIWGARQGERREGRPSFVLALGWRCRHRPRPDPEALPRADGIDSGPPGSGLDCCQSGRTLGQVCLDANLRSDSVRCQHEPDRRVLPLKLRAVKRAQHREAYEAGASASALFLFRPCFFFGLVSFLDVVSLLHKETSVSDILPDQYA